MTWIRFCGLGGKMPPDTAGKDARRYRAVATSEALRLQIPKPQFLATAGK
jgi:hypothetical protein